MRLNVVIRKRTLVEREGNRLLFAGLERHLVERLELLDGTVYAAYLVSNVHLHGFLAEYLTRILHGERKFEVLRVYIDFGLLYFEIGVPELGIR